MIQNTFEKKYINPELKQEYDRYVKTNIPVERLKQLIKKSKQLGASDIHIEPVVFDQDDIKKGLLVQIRIRIGGVLEFFDKISGNDLSGFIMMGEDFENYIRGIKIYLNLGGTDGTIPLDTNFNIKDESIGININLRFSFCPVGIELKNSLGFFPKIVIRILDNNKGIINLEEIGLLESDKKIIRKFLGQNQGLLIMAGPTGSGKTTTLYSMLNELNTPDVNIQTIEDPIEYRIPGLNQSQINYKSEVPYTFSLALRSFLRQDPDVIMVGETRDKETGQIAIEAGTTGHLVFTTIHSNSSIEIFSRLIQMGIEKYQVINGVNIGFSQRLQRKVCPHCGIKHKYKKEYVDEFIKQFQGFDFGKLTKNDFLRLFIKNIPETIAEQMESNFNKLKEKLEYLEYELYDDKNNNILLNELEKTKSLYKELNDKIFKKIIDNITNNIEFIEANTSENNNCKYCLGQGYLGRSPIFEIIENDEDLGVLLTNNATKKELKRYVEKKGIFTLKKYSFLLFMEGQIDFKSYLSV